MKLLARIARHTRITWRNYRRPTTPPFVILFINSICNMTCEHCFYWRSLNRRDDLTREELTALSRELGRIENLNLSGGEPFLRPDFSEICRQFIRQNRVRQIYVPTNAYHTQRTVAHVRATLAERGLELFAVELSLDGLAEFHDRFRGIRGAFARAMETYDALAELQAADPRLRVHAISTATDVNLDEIRGLSRYLFERCPRMDHHNLALIRGDRKNPTLRGPQLAAYQQLYADIRALWAPREHGRYGAVVEPMLQWAKVRTATAARQVIPCRAGILTAVVYANGDVSVCESHPPLGNLRTRSFREIWASAQARERRASIRRRECYCTNEVFLWPSIVYSPARLARGLLSARPWRSAPAGHGTAASRSHPAPG